MSDPKGAFEDDGCICRFRYYDDGRMDVLNICSYHEVTAREAFRRGQEAMRERAAVLCEHPADVIRDIEPCTAMQHEEDCHSKDAIAIRALPLEEETS